MSAPETAAGRPPKPPERKCQHPGCIATPIYPGKDWSVFCGMHSGPPAHRLAAWVARFAERDPQDAEDYGYNAAINDIVRELRTPTAGSEPAPIEGGASADLIAWAAAHAAPPSLLAAASRILDADPAPAAVGSDAGGTWDALNDPDKRGVEP